MNARFNLKPIECIDTPETKQIFNRKMFSEAAPKYDFATKALSLGRDMAWKRRLLASLPKSGSPTCIDLACGTGDLTRMLAEHYPNGKITGLDLTPEMLTIANKLTNAFNVEYVEGSMATLPFETESTDIVTGGYALRNAPDLNQTLDEIDRILKPGGYAAFLDFSKPKNKLGQTIGPILLKFWGGLWGLVLHGNSDVHGYIADSLRQYPDRAELRARFAKRGFILKTNHKFYGGLLEALVFKKEESHATRPNTPPSQI
jgi:ubiquinone/menaquinone biosynthesis methyltransferase